MKLPSALSRLLILKPATRKYIEVLKNARNVVWFARTVLCKASFSLRIRSLFTLCSILTFSFVIF